MSKLATVRLELDEGFARQLLADLGERNDPALLDVMIALKCQLDAVLPTPTQAQLDQWRKG